MRISLVVRQEALVVPVLVALDRIRRSLLVSSALIGWKLVAARMKLCSTGKQLLVLKLKFLPRPSSYGLTSRRKS